jgi:hypothetical protein
MAMVVYVLCALTSLMVAVLMLRGYARTKVPLLLWVGLCFVGLFLNNAILIVDVRLGGLADLSVWRTIPALLGLLVLLYGLIWESRA